jgi:hypothetical protein
MARRTVTVTHAVEVARSPVVVFDYTQDPARRTDWDPSFRSVELVSVDPRRIRGDQDGLGRVTIEYKLFRRPERTSAAFLEIHSRWFSGGGGSWSYEPAAGGAATRWTQTNTMQLKHDRVGALIAPVVRSSLRRTMERSMATAKRILESGAADAREEIRGSEPASDGYTRPALGPARPGPTRR